MAAEASLSRTLKQGLNPLPSRYVKISSNVLTIVDASLSGMALTKMVFVV